VKDDYTDFKKITQIKRDKLFFVVIASNSKAISLFSPFRKGG